MHTHIYLSLTTSMSIYIYIHTSYICIHTDIHTYIHTHISISVYLCKKINTSQTHTENNTPDTDTHAHDKNNTPNPQTNTSHEHLTTPKSGATTYTCIYIYARRTPRPCSVCGSPRLCRRRERCLIMARFGRWPLAWRKI